LAALLFTGCSQAEYNEVIISEQEQRIEQLTNEISALETQKQTLTEEVVELKEEKGVAQYIVTIEIKQSHPFWEVKDSIKDEMNAIEVEIPVSEEYYDAVEIGTVINNEFRMGSLIMSSSIGSWDVTITNKEIK